jgi:hypothetical protein
MTIENINTTEQEFNKFTEIEQFRNCIKEISYFYPIKKPILKFIGTTKIHGTNSGVALPENFTQSRTQIITPENDNYGFARFHSERKEIFTEIYNHVINQFNLPKDTKIVVYGEWAGRGIQKGVGVSELDKSMYIFAIKVLDDSEEGHYWLNNWTIPNKLDSFNIYDIKKYGVWEIDIDFENPQLVQNQLVDWTIRVEQNCPVAHYYGKSNLIGEGIVWEYITEKGMKFSFKVKGKLHSSSNVKVLASVDIEKLNSITEFVDYCVTESRLEQAYSILFESKNINPDMKDISSFIKWVSDDVLKEESDTLKENNLTMKDIGSLLSRKSKNWFINKL